MKNKSEVWNHFKKLNVGGQWRYACTYCNGNFGPFNATKKRKHLLNCSMIPLNLKKKLRGDNDTDTVRGRRKKKNGNCRDDDEETDVEDKTDDDHDGYDVEMQINEVQVQQDNNNGNHNALQNFCDRMSPEDQKKAEKLFAKALYVTSGEFTYFQHPLWKQFFQFIRPSFKLPGYYALANGLLLNEHAKAETAVKIKLQEAVTKHLQCDGWANIRNEGIINFIITVPEPVFVKYVNTKTNRHTAEYLEVEIVAVLKEFGINEFFVIIGDNAANIQKAFRLIQTQYPHIVVLGCVAHGLHLLCKDIMKIPLIKDFLTTAKNIVKTVKGSQILSGIFIDIRKQDNIRSSVQLPGKTRWGSHVFMMKSLIKTRPALKKLVVDEKSNDVVSENPHLSKILDSSFWVNLNGILGVLKPIVDLIYEIEGDDPGNWRVIPSLNTMVNKIKFNLARVTLLDEESKSWILQLVEARMQFIIRPIYYAAALLNPKNQGQTFSDEQLQEAYNFIGYTCDYMNVDKDLVMLDLINYKMRKGIWAQQRNWTLAGKVEARDWWKALHPNKQLSKVAQKILSAPCTSASTERANSRFASQHTKQRNKLDTDRAGKLTYIAQNYYFQNAGKNDNKKERKALVDVELTENDFRSKEREKLEKKQEEAKGNLESPEQDLEEEPAQFEQNEKVYGRLFHPDFQFDVDCLDEEEEEEDQELAEEYKEIFNESLFSPNDALAGNHQQTEGKINDPLQSLEMESMVNIPPLKNSPAKEIDLNTLPFDYLIKNSLLLNKTTGLRQIVLNGKSYTFTFVQKK